MYWHKCARMYQRLNTMINDLSGLVSAAGLSQDGGVLVTIVG